MSLSWYWASVSPSNGSPVAAPTSSVTTSKYFAATFSSKQEAMLAGVVPMKPEELGVKICGM